MADDSQVDEFWFQPGEFYSFRCTPPEGFSGINAGKYSALKILDLDLETNSPICAAVLDGLFDAPPSFDQVKTLGILHMARNGLNKPAVGKLPFVDRFHLPTGFALIKQTTPVKPNDTNPKPGLWQRLTGQVHKSAPIDEKPTPANPPDAAEHNLCIHAMPSSWNAMQNHMDFEWRWRHDQEAYKHEHKAWRDALEQSRKSNLQNLRAKPTLGKLSKKTPFAAWDMDPMTLPQSFVDKARAHIQDVIKTLQALGKKPKKEAVRDIFKDSIEWFNVNGKGDGGLRLIETSERDHICAIFSEMARATGHPDLADEIHDWREW